MRERFTITEDGAENYEFDEFTVAAQAERMTKAQLKKALRMTRDQMKADAIAAHKAGRHSFFFYHNNVSYEW
jgi:hypothetical protein